VNVGDNNSSHSSWTIESKAAKDGGYGLVLSASTDVDDISFGSGIRLTADTNTPDKNVIYETWVRINDSNQQSFVWGMSSADGNQIIGQRIMSVGTGSAPRLWNVVVLGGSWSSIDYSLSRNVAWDISEPVWYKLWMMYDPVNYNTTYRVYNSGGTLLQESNQDVNNRVVSKAFLEFRSGDGAPYAPVGVDKNVYVDMTAFDYFKDGNFFIDANVADKDDLNGISSSLFSIQFHLTITPCSCPTSGFWEITTGNFCLLSTTCSLTGTLHIASGAALHIASGGILNIASTYKAIIEQGGRLSINSGASFRIQR
jgi:hypothetical protein